MMEPFLLQQGAVVGVYHRDGTIATKKTVRDEMISNYNYALSGVFVDMPDNEEYRGYFINKQFIPKSSWIRINQQCDIHIAFKQLHAYDNNQNITYCGVDITSSIRRKDWSDEG